jgi:leucyl aminopeptidase
MAAFDCARALVLGTILGTYQHIRLKTEDVKDNSIELFEIVELSPGKLDDIEHGIRRAEVIGDAITFARDLANEPSNIVTPSHLSNIAEEMATEFDMRCAVRDRAGIEEEGMNLLAAVARGSGVEPRFIEMRYEFPNAEKTVAIVGKGITFDSGGYSLKTAEGMQDMKGDMAGAAAVLAAMRAVGKLKPSVNVLALIPATENSIGGQATHPGDVFKSYSGKTVEIVDTDAEGRLILADAIAYASKAGVDEIVDVATLTGACVVALGKKISGILGTEQSLVDRLIEAGASCGEKLWQLPLDSDYKDQIRSDIADLKNGSSGKGAGPITAALFMEAFTSGVAWAHIDLSASDTDEDTPLAKKGNTGAGAGTLIEYLLGF